jgi:hypothetical protein
MVEEELELFPNAASVRHAFGTEPDSKAKHTRETCIADDDEKGPQK